MQHQGPVVVSEREAPMIVDIRNEEHIRKQMELEAKQKRRQSSRNSSSRELRRVGHPQ